MTINSNPNSHGHFVNPPGLELHGHEGGLGGSFVTDILFHGNGPGSQHPDVDALHEFLGVPNDFHPPCVVTEPVAFALFLVGMVGLGGFHWLIREKPMH